MSSALTAAVGPHARGGGGGGASLLTSALATSPERVVAAFFNDRREGVGFAAFLRRIADTALPQLHDENGSAHD